MQENLKEKIDHIKTIMEKLEGNKRVSLIDILKEEINKLKDLNKQYKEIVNKKKVIHKETDKNKTRYYLKDGSTYVVKENKYRYLYDSQSKIVTYQFQNGQIERTFPEGLKEVRYPNGDVVIKCGDNEYDLIKEKM